MKIVRWLGQLVLTAGVFALVYVYWYPIVDTVTTLGHTPSSTMRAIEKKTTLTSEAARIFYASKPEIGGAKRFNEVCGSAPKEHSAVLGCYAQRKIYLFDVKNPELAGIVEVTAAHEMLHAVYERLHTWEREPLKKLLLTEYERQKTKNNTVFLKHVQLYSDLPRDAYINELHSLIGTEVADISPQLEAHFANYMSDRKSVVAMYRSYEAVFRKAEEESNRLAKKIDSDTTKINQQIARYNAGTEALNVAINTFNARAERGDFASERAFRTQRSGLMARAAALESEYASIVAATRQNDADRARLKELSVRIDALNSSINSAVKPSAEL